MSDLELLTQLAQRQYEVTAVTLHPIHQQIIDGRGIYRLDQKDRPPWLLQAFRVVVHCF
jgi:hypothetical protein